MIIMTSQAIREQMRDYLVARLEGSGSKIEPVTKEIIPGIKSNYIRVGDNWLVLSVDQFYPDEALEMLHERVNGGGKDIAFVFLGDRETFFRSAEDAGRDKKHGKSLKNSSYSEVLNLIYLRPEEKYVSAKRGKTLQFYHPQFSDPEFGTFPEKIVSYQFKPALLTYGHIKRGFKPDNCESKRFYSWHNRVELQGALNVENGVLIERPKVNINITESSSKDHESEILGKS